MMYAYNSCNILVNLNYLNFKCDLCNISHDMYNITYVIFPQFV